MIKIKPTLMNIFIDDSLCKYYFLLQFAKIIFYVESIRKNMLLNVSSKYLTLHLPFIFRNVLIDIKNNYDKVWECTLRIPKHQFKRTNAPLCS